MDPISSRDSLTRFVSSKRALQTSKNGPAKHLDETEVGEGTTITLITRKRPAEWKETTNPADCARAWPRSPRSWSARVGTSSMPC